MPVTPKQLSERRERVDFTFGGEPVFVEYYPAVLSGDGLPELQAIQAKIRAATSEAEGAAALKEFASWLARLLAAWDYLEDPTSKDGTPGPMVPLTPERIERELNRFGDFVAGCANAATEHFTSGKSIGTASSGR